ncbi:MAG TPA: OmpA family protein, partial [Puia sp.]|nr:OmpA family protein [Puia sp.]
QVSSINLELNASKENNMLLRKQMQALSALSSVQAESIKKSMDNIGAKDEYIQELRAAVSHRDSVNMVALMNMKAYLGNQGQDVVIRLEKGEVYVDLSDSLLFGDDSAGYVLNNKAKPVLGRLARALNNQPDVAFVIEAHMDSLITDQQGVQQDGWDLASRRAAVIARTLTNDYKVSAARMTSAGRLEPADHPSATAIDSMMVIPDSMKATSYSTGVTSDSTKVMPDSIKATPASVTPAATAAHRYTRIVILPQLDQLVRLLERKKGQEPPPPPPPASVPAAAPASTATPATEPVTPPATTAPGTSSGPL